MSRRDSIDGGGLPFEEITALFDDMADGVYVVDADQHIRYWNDAAERLTGEPRDAVLGRVCYEIMCGTDYDGHCYCREDCATIASARKGQSVPAYDVLAHPGGRRLWTNVSILAVHAAEYDRPLAVHIFRKVMRPRTLEVLANQAVDAVSRHGGSAGEPPPVERLADPLTDRELEVLRLLAAGAPVRSIAQELVITRATVRAHIEHILNKLGAHSRWQAVVIAANLGLI